MKRFRLVSLFLAVGFVFGLGACNRIVTPTASPGASPTPAPSPTPGEQYTGFLKNVSEKLGGACAINGTTIKLTQNVRLKDNAELLLDSAEMFTLDFNGHVITAQITKAGASLISCTNGSLTLTDSSGGGGIIMTSNVEAYAVSCLYEGSMNINGINVSASLSGTNYQGIRQNRTGAYALLAKEGGRLTVNGGSYGGNLGLVIEYVRRKPAVTLNAGTFSGFVDLSGGSDISAFLGSGKKAVKGADGSIAVSNS